MTGAGSAKQDDWSRIKSIYCEALERDADQRDELLERECAGNTALLARVRELLERGAGGDLVNSGQITAARSFEYSCAGERVFEPGDLVAGRYRITEFLGEGGMGEVYAAEDIELGGQVALKTLRPALSGNSELVSRFKQEIQLARSVTHAGISRVFDLSWHAGSSAARAFLTMELLEGQTLADLIRRQSGLNRSLAFDLATQIAAGLEAAHRAGVIHRDLKPANIFITGPASSPRAVITDFGLALRAGFDTASAFGTPPYLAPEQLTGGPIGPAVDIYAFGVVLFEMLAGRTPFSTMKDAEMASAKIRGAVPRLRSVLPGASSAWDRAIVRCLALDPGGRPQSALDVIPLLKRNSTRRAWIAGGAVAAVSASAAVAFRLASPHPTINPDAVVHFKEAVEFARRRNADGLANAVTEYQAAIRLQPDYADAWTGLADALAATGNFQFADPKIALAKARDAARKAISLDSRNARAHGLLAYCMSIDVHEWLKAEPSFRHALSLDSNDADLHLWFGSFLGKLARAREAIAEEQAGLRIDPANLSLKSQLVTEYYRARMPTEHMHESLDLVRMFPLEATAWLQLARAYESAGEWDKAIECCDKADKYQVSRPAQCIRGSIEAARGDARDAAKIAADIENYWRSNPFEALLIAALRCRMGEGEKALSILNAGYERNDGSILIAPTHPHFDPLRGSAGWLAFRRRIGLNA